MSGSGPNGDDGASSRDALEVVVGIITRRRPAELRRLIASLDGLSPPSDVVLSVLLVENDAPREEPPPSCRWPLRRVFEPTPGIPAARNRVLDEAVDACDRLVFVDDDQTVEPNLIAELLRVEREFAADAVTGPALPRFPEGAPGWARRSRAYEPPRYPTGSLRAYAFTNNVMVRCELLRDRSLRFDERMRFSGGSDKEFFLRFAARGRRIVWADEAIVWEWYPMERLRRRWLFRRSYRLGCVALRVEGRGGASGRIALLWRALRFTGRAAVRGARSALDPPVALAHVAWDLGRAAGLVVGAFGGGYDEYASR